MARSDDRLRRVRAGPVAPPEGDGAVGREAAREPARLDPLPDLVGYVLRRAHTAFFARFRRRFAALDLRPVQLGILTAVGNNPGLRQSDVSETLGIQRANLAPLLDELAARRLLTRVQVAADRRSYALALTPDGERLLAEGRRCEAALENELTAALGEAGRRRLVHLLTALEAACRDAPDEA